MENGRKYQTFIQFAQHSISRQGPKFDLAQVQWKPPFWQFLSLFAFFFVFFLHCFTDVNCQLPPVGSLKPNQNKKNIEEEEKIPKNHWKKNENNKSVIAGPY